MLVACGGGGASGWYGGSGGDGGGAGVAGSIWIRSKSWSRWNKYNDGESTSAAGILPSGQLAKIESCTTGGYWNGIFTML